MHTQRKKDFLAYFYRGLLKRYFFLFVDDTYETMPCYLCICLATELARFLLCTTPEILEWDSATHYRFIV
jgi:hypothetical protein